MGNQGVKDGHFLMGSALLNDNGDMCGSVMIVDYPSRAELDTWLKVEPYIIGNV